MSTAAAAITRAAAAILEESEATRHGYALAAMVRFADLALQILDPSAPSYQRDDGELGAEHALRHVEFVIGRVRERLSRPAGVNAEGGAS